MLKVMRHHQPPCRKAEWDPGTNCSCRLFLRGTVGGKRIFLATSKYLPSDQASNLEAARDLAMLWERNGKPVRPEASALIVAEPAADVALPTIESGIAAYMNAANGAGLAKSTLEKKRTVFTTGPQSLTRFAADRGLRFLSELTAPLIRDEWRPTWNLGALTRFKRQKSVLGFFWFCERSGWYPHNYTTDLMKALGRITVQKTQTGYFPPEEYAKILDATWLYSDRPSIDKHNSLTVGGERIRALTELMRWTGLRIRDAVTLEKSKLTRDPQTGMWSVIVYQKKTGEDVYCPLPPDVAEMLINVPESQKGNTNATYFFWTGNGDPKTVVSNWQRSYGKLFKLAGIVHPDGTPKRCYPHMFRDTYAVESLLSGMRIEDVSTILGHTSIKTTQESYMPWVRARQNSLNTSVYNSWVQQGKVKIAGGIPPKRARIVPIKKAG